MFYESAHVKMELPRKRQVRKMKLLSNEILLDSYLRALDLQLEPEFIDLLLKEIKRRKLHVPNHYSQAQAN